jgi:hypothetical protein
MEKTSHNNGQMRKRLPLRVIVALSVLTLYLVLTSVHIPPIFQSFYRPSQPNLSHASHGFAEVSHLVSQLRLSRDHELTD